MDVDPERLWPTLNSVVFHARHPFTDEWIIPTIPLHVAEAAQRAGEA